MLSTLEMCSVPDIVVVTTSTSKLVTINEGCSNFVNCNLQSLLILKKKLEILFVQTLLKNGYTNHYDN